jgi:hypothetical protein
MTEQEQRFTFAVAAMIGLVARGAKPKEISETLWRYADLALASKPKENETI